MSSVDWSKAPQKTTHYYPQGPWWEKWEDGLVYQYIDSPWPDLTAGLVWVPYEEVSEADEKRRVVKPKEKIVDKSLKQNIERMQKELDEMKARLVVEKWEPKGGSCRSSIGGNFRSRSQVHIASRMMRERLRLIQYVLEHEPDWKFEFVADKRNSFVYYDHRQNKWTFTYSERGQSQEILMPEWVADELVKDLNSGWVVL